MLLRNRGAGGRGNRGNVPLCPSFVDDEGELASLARRDSPKGIILYSKGKMFFLPDIIGRSYGIMSFKKGVKERGSREAIEGYNQSFDKIFEGAGGIRGRGKKVIEKIKRANVNWQA